MDNFSNREKKKYERVWRDIPTYGDYSPAVQIVADVIKMCNDAGAETLLDAGCGAGRATSAIIDAGIKAYGVDITLKAVDSDILEKHKGSFHEHSLWELPLDWPKFDCVFCADVMEHIPPERICRTLASLKRVLKGFAVFKIALMKDGFGKRIGEPLHISLYSADEWEEKLSDHFYYIKRSEETPYNVTFICRMNSLKI